MKRRVWTITVASLAVVAAVVCAATFLPGSRDVEATWDDSSVLSLTRPPFVGAAAGGTSFLDQEAGISAYTKVDQQVDLAKAATGFKTVEYQTSEYIIGSVALPGLPETEDVHAYVHKDGWMLTYYFIQEPIAKIINWNSLASTKPEAGIAKLCDAAGVSFVWANFYDFRYPDVDKLMVIIDYDSFRLKIPGSFSVYARSYSLRGTGGYSGCTNALYIGEDEIARTSSVKYGALTPTQLVPDVFHAIRTTCTGTSHGVAIVLAYREG